MTISSCIKKKIDNSFTVLVVICIVCTSRTSLAQDFEKTLMEQRVSLNGEEVTILARHIYYKAVKLIGYNGIERSRSAALVEVDVVHNDGHRVPIWRIATTSPYEVHRDYRLMFPVIPILDVAVWRRDRGDALLIGFYYGGNFTYNSAPIVYQVDSGSVLPMIPDPPVLKQGKYNRVLHAAGPWEPMSLDEMVGSPASQSFLFRSTPPLEMMRTAAKRKRGSHSAVEMLSINARRGPHGVVRVLTQGSTIKVLTDTGIATEYDTKTKAITYRMVTDSEEQLVADAPMKYSQMPSEDFKRIWEEWSAPHSHPNP